MDPEEYLKKIELEVLKIIEQKLTARQMKADRAREIAKYILSTLHPHMNMNQIYAVVSKFDEQFPELIPVVVQVSQDYEDKIKKIVGEHVGNLLKQNKVSEATIILKKALNKEIKLPE